MTKTHGQRYLGCKQRLCWSASESLCSAATGCYHHELRLASQVLGGASEPWWASIRKQNNVFCSNCILRSLNCTYMYSMYTHTYLLFTTSHMKVISIALMCGFSHTHTIPWKTYLHVCSSGSSSCHVASSSLRTTQLRHGVVITRLRVIKMLERRRASSTLNVCSASRRGWQDSRLVE